MAALLIFRDLINDLQKHQEPVSGGAQASKEATAELVVETEQVASVKTKSTPAVANKVPGLVQLTEVATMLPCREYKIHGGQISDSDFNFNHLSKQIDEGLAEGFTEAEIIRTVFRLLNLAPLETCLSPKKT